MRQEAVQQALAALHDKQPKQQLLPLPSKRASVASSSVVRPAANQPQEDDDDDDDDDDDVTSEDDEVEYEEGGDGSLDNLLVETRNMALGLLSDTSSTGSLASGPSAVAPPLRSLPPLPLPPDESPPPPPLPPVLSKPLPPSPKAAPSPPPVSLRPRELGSVVDGDGGGGGGGNSKQQQLPPATSSDVQLRHHHRRREERPQRQDSESGGSGSRPPPLPPPQRDSQIEAVAVSGSSNSRSGGGGSGGRSAQAVTNNNRIKRSSLIENQTKPTTTNTADLLQNIEPYDVLFLSSCGDLPKQTASRPPPPILSSTPDVAILPTTASSTPTGRGGPLPPPPPPPNKAPIHRHSSHIGGSVRISTTTSSKYSHPGDWQGSSDPTGTASRWKVSAKIQQLLNTLKKPKRRPLPEFYEDDDVELELAAKNNKDPNAPAPEGSPMSPAVGPQLVIPAGLPRSLEAAIQRYGSATYKAPMATVLDPNGKLSITLSYGKLWSRSLKIAYALLNKIGLSGSSNNKEGGGGGVAGSGQVKPGDRIALVYPNNDPLNMICAFYGCVMAGAVPVPIEVPITRRDAGSSQIGFLLGSCGISLALTSEACYKGLPKATGGSGGGGGGSDVLQFKGWPRLQWFITEHLARPPKEWSPPPRLTDDTPAYVEYTTQQDGSVLGVSVARTAMLAMARTLTLACGYTEGEIMVCVLDFKRDAGLWHAVIASVFNGMHVIFIPYALMKINPASWMQMITKHRASIAVV